MRKKISSSIIVILLFLAIPNTLFSAKETSGFKSQAQFYREKGHEAQKIYDLATAMAFYQKAIVIDPSFAAPYNDIGVIFELYKQDDRAEAYYLKAIELDPKYIAVYSNLALFYEKKGEYLKAAHLWKKRIEVGGTYDVWTQKAKERLVYLSTVSEEVKKELDEEEAANLAREMRERKKREVEEKIMKVKASLESAKDSLSRSDYVNALKECQEAINLDPENAEANELLAKVKDSETRFLIAQHFKLAKQNFARGDYVNAQKECQEVINLDPENSEAAELLAQSKDKEQEVKIKEYSQQGLKYFQAGDTFSAREEFNKILTIISKQSTSTKQPIQENPGDGD